MSAASHVFDVDEAGFELRVLERSREIPVLVDFWAAWCGPCRALAPVLESLAAAYGGRFELAKVDTEACPNVASALGIRSLPTVRLFRDARAVEEFVGVQPESAIRALLDRHVGGGAGETRDTARALLDRGDLAGALAALENGLAESPGDPGLLCDLALLHVGAGDLDAAERRLAELAPDARFDPDARRAGAALQFARMAETASPIDALEEAICRDPTDCGTRLALGARRVVLGEVDAGVDCFLEVLRRDRAFSDDAGRRCMLAVFDLLGDGDPRVQRFRGLMARAVF